MKALSIVLFLIAITVGLVSTQAAAALCVVAFIFAVAAIIQEGPGLQK